MSAVTWLLCEQPMYQGPGHIEELSPAELTERVLEPGTSKEAAAVSWLVELWAPWSSKAVHLAPVLAELSLRYGGEGRQLRFAQVNMEQWPGVGAELGVPTKGPSAWELPVFLLFRGGKEERRLPDQAGLGRQGGLGAKQLLEVFELEKRSHGEVAAAPKSSGPKPRPR